MSTDKVKKGVKKNYFTSYNMIFDTSLSIYAKAVYLYMCRCSDSQYQSFPSHKNIAEKCSCGVTKVKEAIKELEVEKLVVKQNRFRKTNSGKLAQTSNLYIVYDRPLDTIPPDELEDIADECDNDVIVDNPSHNTTTYYPSHNTSTPQSPDDSHISYDTTTPLSHCDYKGITTLRTTQNKGIKINQSINDSELIEELNSVFRNCKIELYNDSLQPIIKNSVIDMYCSEDFSKKTGIPKIIIQERLKSMDLYTIDRALSNYKNAVTSGVEITAPMKYFQKCIWTAMNDDKLDLFCVS